MTVERLGLAIQWRPPEMSFATCHKQGQSGPPEYQEVSQEVFVFLKFGWLGQTPLSSVGFNETHVHRDRPPQPTPLPHRALPFPPPEAWLV